MNFMGFEIIEIGPDQIRLYASIPIVFEVETVFQVEPINDGLGGFALIETRVSKPYTKNYDAYEDGGPERWLKRFNVANWGFFLIKDKDTAIGGAAIVHNSPDVQMLDSRDDLAVLWDIRIHPDFRRRKVGTMLFNHAVSWARQRNCRQLKIETQNVNVPACKFYNKLGCHLGVVHRYGYQNCPEVAGEVMLIWYYDIGK